MWNAAFIQVSVPAPDSTGIEVVGLAISCKCIQIAGVSLEMRLLVRLARWLLMPVLGLSLKRFAQCIAGARQLDVSEVGKACGLVDRIRPFILSIECMQQLCVGVPQSLGVSQQRSPSARPFRLSACIGIQKAKARSVAGLVRRYMWRLSNAY